jgi:uncharacterized Tic20 family protein
VINLYFSGLRDTNAKSIRILRKDSPYFTLFFCSCQTFTLLFPCFMSLMLLFDPCIPPFPKWWVASSCSSAGDVITKESNIQSQIAAMVSSILTFCVSANIIASAVFTVMYGPLGMMFAFLSHLEYIKNKTHNLSLQPFHRRIIMYRGVQLLVGLFNECYQWVFFTVLSFMVYFIISVNLFVFVRVHADISPAVSCLLGSFSVQGFFYIFILNSLSGKVYHSSRSLLTAWSRNSSLGNSRFPNIWVKKTVRSCQGIKIRMGSVNFIDRLTPFVICGFCVRLAVRLSLAMKE